MVAAKTTKSTKKAPVKAEPVIKELLSVPTDLTCKNLCDLLSTIVGIVVPDKDAFFFFFQAGEMFKLEPYEPGRGADYTKEYLTRVVEKYNGQNA